MTEKPARGQEPPEPEPDRPEPERPAEPEPPGTPEPFEEPPPATERYVPQPVPPELGGSTGRGRRVRRFRLTAWIALVLAAVVVGASVLWVNGPPTEAELREKAGLFGKETLRIGVKDDTPGIALQDRSGARVFRGFDIDIAYMIAADLGYPKDRVAFMAIETEDRARMQARDKDGLFVRVDLVVATFSVTPERQRDPSVGFSTPYLYTEQSVVTRSDYEGKVTSLGQLRGKKVCTLGTSTSEVELERATRADVTAKNRISDCIEGLKNGEYDAVTTDAAILAGFVKESAGELVHHDIALEKTEMWAVNAGPNAALRDLINLALYRSYADPQNHGWEDAYKDNIEPMLAASRDVNVAQSEQPCVLPPPIRRWPWERGLAAAQECLSR
ncbi:transporter substrate-binding domain-containing protein [Streptosporangium jomthongense]|uniref:Transporter substrate-binding domain-containing protein n=1 Tax=Streptosporangium jomthongense TaxID=1193683 RepID=A0ABV8F2U3_9ACTN